MKAGRSAARVPRRRNRPRPLPHPQPPSLPECQGPRNHVSSSQGGRPPRVCGLPGGASMPGHLRRRWTQLAGRPHKGGGAVQRPEPGSRLRQGRAVRTAGQEAAPTMPAARPVAGRRQVWGAWPHPHRKRCSGAASVRGVGGQARSSRRAGGVAGGLGKALPGWPHLHNKRSEMEALVQRAIYKIQSQPLLAPQPPALPCPSLWVCALPLPAQSPAPSCPARPDHMALAGSPFQYQPAKAAGSCRQMQAGFPAPPELQVLGEGSRCPGCLPPDHSRPGRPGRPGHGSRREVAAGARSPSLHAPPPPRARAARQVLRNVPRPGVRGGREASLQPASCLLPPAQLPAGRGGRGRGQPSLAKPTRGWKGPGSWPGCPTPRCCLLQAPTPRCPGPRQTDRSEKWAGGRPREADPDTPPSPLLPGLLPQGRCWVS